ncbi:MAG: hypothetical protein ABJC79_07625 [Acidimicrobiia bacterium]
MDVRNVATVEPEVEHNGTVPVWWLIHPRELKDITDGGDLVSIPPDTVHSLRTTGDQSVHCFCFAVGVKDAPPIDYTNH